MNLNYLTKTILPQRETEKAQGKNLGTMHPIYIVLDLRDHVCSGHTDFDINSTLSGKTLEYGYLDMATEVENRQFTKEPAGKKPEPVTRFFSDRVVAVFLTSKAAHEYLEYQAHNLSKYAFVYVFDPGYRNVEMESLFSEHHAFETKPEQPTDKPITPKLPKRVTDVLNWVVPLFENHPQGSIGKDLANEARKILEENKNEKP